MISAQQGPACSARSRDQRAKREAGTSVLSAQLQAVAGQHCRLLQLLLSTRGSNASPFCPPRCHDAGPGATG